VSCDNDCYEHLLYKASLELLLLALVCYMPYGYVPLWALLKVSLRYVALVLMYLFSLQVNGSSTCVFVCPVGMWLYGQC
jgi:hypothetical protein